jgi:hypothetical protein
VLRRDIGTMAVMRRLVHSVVLVLMLASLVACTRPEARILALAVRDGRPTGVLVTCDAVASQLQVVQTDTKGEPPVSGKPMMRWAVGGTPATVVIEVPLLGSPLPGWAVDDATGVTDPDGSGPGEDRAADRIRARVLVPPRWVMPARRAAGGFHHR